MHGARLDDGRRRLGVDDEHPTEVALEVQDEPGTDRVARDGRAGPARGQGDAELPADRERGVDLVAVPWPGHGERGEPVERGIRGVQRPGQRGPVDVADPGADQRRGQLPAALVLPVAAT